MIYAKVEYPNNGYTYDKEHIKQLDFNKLYEVEEIDIGYSHTNIHLYGFKAIFNSVMFEFYDEDGNKVDIYNQ